MMKGEIVYIPITKEIHDLIKSLKGEKETWDEFFKRLIKEKIEPEEVLSLQEEKMKELWDNKFDEVWDKYKV